jgi:hypothetical protein
MGKTEPERNLNFIMTNPIKCEMRDARCEMRPALNVPNAMGYEGVDCSSYAADMDLAEFDFAKHDSCEVLTKANRVVEAKFSTSVRRPYVWCTRLKHRYFCTIKFQGPKIPLFLIPLVQMLLLRRRTKL